MVLRTRTLIFDAVIGRKNAFFATQYLRRRADAFVFLQDLWEGTATLSAIPNGLTRTQTFLAIPYSGCRTYAFVTFPGPREPARLALRVKVLAWGRAGVTRFAVFGGVIVIFEIALTVVGFGVVLIFDRIDADLWSLGLEVRRF